MCCFHFIVPGVSLAAYLEVTPEDIQDKIQMFKEDGCELFK